VILPGHILRASLGSGQFVSVLRLHDVFIPAWVGRIVGALNGLALGVVLIQQRKRATPGAEPAPPNPDTARLALILLARRV
jgi:hypothetical protein